MSSPQVNSYNILGTAAVPLTLTTAFSASRGVVFSKLQPNVKIEGAYIPAADNDYARILIEESTDGGVIYKPTSTLIISPVEQDIETASGDSLMGSISGIPFIVPGSKNVSSGGTVNFCSNILTTIADHIRLSAVDTNGGTLYLRVSLSD